MGEKGCRLSGLPIPTRRSLHYAFYHGYRLSADPIGSLLASCLAIVLRRRYHTQLQEPLGPTKTSQFEHSSISATITNLFNLSRDKDTALGPVPGFLTQRDAWAGSFHELLTLDSPRKDCPMHLPTPPVPATPFPGGMCDNLLHADCGSNETKSDPSKCAACIEKYRPNLLRAGCQAGTLDAYCKPKWQRSSSITDDRRRLSEAGAAAPQHCGGPQKKCFGDGATVDSKQTNQIRVMSRLTRTPEPDLGTPCSISLRSCCNVGMLNHRLIIMDSY